jgi:hypothetical protein
MRVRLFLSGVALVALALPTVWGCGTSTGPDGACWSDVDTLFVSDVPIRESDDVEQAFTLYAAFVDSTAGAFPGGASILEYRSAAYYWMWEGSRYWRIAHRVSEPVSQEWFNRETLYIDENGVLVSPLGCI